MKLKRCPNLHYYDGDKYSTCPHCAEANKPSAPPPPPPKSKPAVAPITPPPPQIHEPEPVVPPSESGAAAAAAPFAPPTPVPEMSSESASVSVTSPTPVSENVHASAPVPAHNDIPQEENKINDTDKENEQPDKQDEEKGSLTSEIRKVGFTGSIEDAEIAARINSARNRGDNAKTTIIFESYDTDLIFGWLVTVNTADKGKVYSLKEIKNTVGRGDTEHIVDVDIHNDRSISRGSQAIIIYDTMNKKFFLQNANGKTLIYLNGQIVLTYAEVNAYDRIRLGETEMVFVPLCTDKFSWN